MTERNIEVEVHTRATIKVSAKVNGHINPKTIVEQVARSIETPDQIAYAFSVAEPGPAPDSVDIKRYTRECQSLDARSFLIDVKENGAASLTLSQNRGKDWTLVGIFTTREWAESFGSLWKSGIINADLAKMNKAS